MGSFKFNDYFRGLNQTLLFDKCKAPHGFSPFVFAYVRLGVTNVGNKMTIEKYLPNKPSEVLFLGISFMQKWIPLLEGEEQEKMRKTVDDMLTWHMNFSPSALLLSDVGEI